MLFSQRTQPHLIFLLTLTFGVSSNVFAQANPDDLNTSELKVDAVEPRISLPEVGRSTSGSLRVHTISQGKRSESNDGLVRLAQQAVDTTSRRLLSSEQHTPWQMMHALLGLRHDFAILHEGREVNGLEWMAAGQVFDGDQWFEKTVHGGRAHPYSVPYAFEGHANQFLAVLSMCGLETDHEFMTAEGPITIADMIAHAKATCDTRRDEPTWTLWALSRYLPPDAVWKNADGDTWSIERLVADQTSKPLKGAACGGTHGLFALAHARNVYLREGKPLRGVWLQAENKIRYYINTARRLQNSNGSLSSNYLRGRQYNPDFNKRMASAGHVLEFLMIALPQRELNQRWVRRAVEATARDLLNNRKEYVKCSPLYHSVNALNIYLDRVNPRIEEPVAVKERPSRTAMLDRPGISADQATKGISQSQTITQETASEPETTGPMGQAKSEAEPETGSPAENEGLTEKATTTEASKEETSEAASTPEEKPATEAEDQKHPVGESESSDSGEQQPAKEADSADSKDSPQLKRSDIEAVILERLKEIAESEQDSWSKSGQRKTETALEEAASDEVAGEEDQTESGRDQTTPITGTKPAQLAPLRPVPEKSTQSAPDESDSAENSTEELTKPATSMLAPLMVKKQTPSGLSIPDEVDLEMTAEEIPTKVASLPATDSPTLTDDSISERLLLPGRLHQGDPRSNPFSVERPARRLPLGIPTTTVSQSRTLARKAAGDQDGQSGKSKETDKKPTEFPTVPAGINDRFLDPNLDPQEWVERFEIESREIYSAREAIVAATGLKAGQSIADIGAGTGLFTRLFSKQVGAKGQVYAIDISPRLVAHLEKQVQQEGMSNVTVVRNDATSTQLVTTKVDKAFVCDTYHHFERPDAMLKSIHRALNDGGELVVIDFERVPGKSRDWIIGHVRAGKETFRSEIEANGFEFVKEVDVEGLEENYLLIFRRISGE